MSIRRKRKPTCDIPEIPLEQQQQAAVWALHLLLDHGGLNASFSDVLRPGEYFLEPRIQRFLGMPADMQVERPIFDDPISPNVTRKGVRTVGNRLRKRLAVLESSLSGMTLPVALDANVTQLARLLSLTRVEVSLLTFAVMVKTVDELRETAELLGDLGKARASFILANLLGHPDGEVYTAFSKTGTLAQSGILRMTSGARESLPDKLDLLSDAFAERMVSDETTPLDLLRDTVSLCPPPALNWSDFEHMEQDTGLLTRYVGQALWKARHGVNILIHGPSGTGKTETARLLAAHLGVELFEVSCEDEAGDPIDGNARMRAHRAAQVLLANSRAILLFDEAEDIFGRGGGWLGLFGGKEGQAQLRKAWINKALETNPSPTLWLTNSIAGIDPAFVRRFDMVIEMPIPPRKQRERIAARAAGGMLPVATLQRLGACEHLSPALVSRAVSVIDSIRDELPEEDVPRAVERLLDASLQAQGLPRLARGSGESTRYDPALTNADEDLGALANGLVRTKRGRLCLFGPSGTGKTAFAQWLAEELGRPLLAKRGSDLIDMWVGSTERNIAHAFRTAEQEGAVLLLDEVDSFLQDRRTAQRSWEQTQVNEMLTQMENFDGIFIATTNLVNELDQAALRRFDLKVKFDYLSTRQASELLRRQCARLSLAPPKDGDIARLARLHVLTPGDFAAAGRQHAFHPLTTPQALVDAIMAECRFKEVPSKPIGFVQ